MTMVRSPTTEGNPTCFSVGHFVGRRLDVQDVGHRRWLDVRSAGRPFEVRGTACTVTFGLFFDLVLDVSDTGATVDVLGLGRFIQHARFESFLHCVGDDRDAGTVTDITTASSSARSHSNTPTPPRLLLNTDHPIDKIQWCVSGRWSLVSIRQWRPRLLQYIHRGLNPSTRFYSRSLCSLLSQSHTKKRCTAAGSVWDSCPLYVSNLSSWSADGTENPPTKNISKVLPFCEDSNKKNNTKQIRFWLPQGPNCFAEAVAAEPCLTFQRHSPPWTKGVETWTALMV